MTSVRLDGGRGATVTVRGGVDSIMTAPQQSPLCPLPLLANYDDPIAECSALWT